MDRKAEARGRPLPCSNENQMGSDGMTTEQKKARGRWHTDRYWLGWVDAMRRSQRIVDGTIDDEPMYAPSTGETMEDKQG